MENHVRNYNGDCKKAFASGVRCFHADGKTPIKRVRIVQSSVTREKLANDKFGAMRKHDSEPFKWLAYGNYHHVDIYRNNRTKKYKSIFVTMAEAAKRVKTGGSSIAKNEIESYDFLMTLHKNDYVQFQGANKIYRVQALESPLNLILRI
ncbi:type II CRISPR RNA-guided endonuclease Cas9, partial [bacterium]|nr:type II CRISPR RNA-guided endonuclease Cas9 [bacterium]